MRSGVSETAALVFCHSPFRGPTIRNVGHSKQTAAARALLEKMATYSIGESGQKKDQGSRDGGGETDTQQRNWRKR